MIILASDYGVRGFKKMHKSERQFMWIANGIALFERKKGLREREREKKRVEDLARAGARKKDGSAEKCTYDLGWNWEERSESERK